MQLTNIGFPNVYGGIIKKAVESFWGGAGSLQDITAPFHTVCRYNTCVQADLDFIPIFDVDVYDRLLKTAVMFGIVPQRFGSAQEANDDLSVYLSIPRGTQKSAASPMVKWFNTNYHVVQPEIERKPELVKDHLTPLVEVLQSQVKRGALKPALIGPWTLLSYAINKTSYGEEELFDALSGAYTELINTLSIPVVQIEEPSFLTRGVPASYCRFLQKITKRCICTRILVQCVALLMNFSRFLWQAWVLILSMGAVILIS